MYLEAGRNDEAIAILRETARINPDHCNAHYNLGATLIRVIRCQEALDALSRAMACYQREGRVGGYIADTHYNQGVALAALARYREAEAQFRAVLQIDPNYPRARVALAEALMRQGKGTRGVP